MGGRVLFLSRQNIFRNRKENTRILPEDMNIKDFLRIAKSQMFQLGVETSVLRPEIRDTKTCGDLGILYQHKGLCI